MAKAKETKQKYKGAFIVLPTFRCAFPNLFEPRAFEAENGAKGEPKYDITMLWPKKKEKEELKLARLAVAKAAKERFGEKEDWPEELELPWRDGDEYEDLQGFKGMRVLRASTLNPPGVVDQNKEEILEAKRIYGGCYCRASVVFKAWEMGTQGKRGYRAGVTCYLQNVQLVAKGEKMGGGSNADDDFDVIESDDDDTNSDDDDIDLGF